MKIFRHVLTSSTQPLIWSIHVVVRTRTAKRCMKMKNARAGHAELLFLLTRAIVLWRSLSRRRRPCVSSLLGSFSNDNGDVNENVTILRI